MLKMFFSKLAIFNEAWMLDGNHKFLFTNQNFFLLGDTGNYKFQIDQIKEEIIITVGWYYYHLNGLYLLPLYLTIQQKFKRRHNIPEQQHTIHREHLNQYIYEKWTEYINRWICALLDELLTFQTSSLDYTGRDFYVKSFHK